MKPELLNDMKIYKNERELPSNNNYDGIIKHPTDFEQRSTSIDKVKQEEAQRAPIIQGENSILMHSVHEFDQDSMLPFGTEDMVPRKLNRLSNSFITTKADQNKRDIQRFESQTSPPRFTKQDSINHDSSYMLFGDYNSIGITPCSCSSLNQSALHDRYISAQHKAENSDFKNNNQALIKSDQNNDSQKHFNSLVPGYGPGHNELFSHQDNSILSKDKEYQHYSQDQANEIAKEVLNFKKDPISETQRNTEAIIPVYDRFDLINNDEKTNAHDIIGNNVVSSSQLQSKPTLKNPAAKKNAILNTGGSQLGCHECQCNYVITKIVPTKFTHKPYDVPTFGQFLLNNAIQERSFSTDTTDSTSTNFFSKPSLKIQTKKFQNIHCPYDVPTQGQTIMRESISKSSQKYNDNHCIFDVPTKAQQMLNEATTVLSIQGRLVSSYNAITESILSIPIESPPSPEDSDDEPFPESNSTESKQVVKERLPLTYAQNASNRAFNFINNGYPPSPKLEEVLLGDNSTDLHDESHSVHIKLESIEGSPSDIQSQETGVFFLSNKMPGSFDSPDISSIHPGSALYDFVPVSHISEKEEPAIHGQTACYTTLDIVKPEIPIKDVSTSLKKCEIEPSIFGQAPSFYPDETTDPCLKDRYIKNQVTVPKDNDNKIQSDSYNKRYEIVTMYHGNQDFLDKSRRPLQQYEKVIPTNEVATISEMSMAIPLPDKIDVDDFSFEIQKPADKDEETQKLAYNEVLVPVEFDEDNVKEINPEQVETVKVKNSFLKKISLTPQQALRFYNNHSTIIDFALTTNPVGAAFVVAKGVNNQRLSNKKAREELAAEKLAHPERFVEGPPLSFKERLMNAPKSAVKVINESQGYVNAVLAATPGGKVLDAARLANDYARAGAKGFTHASNMQKDGIKNTSQKLALGNMKSYGSSYIPSFSFPGASSGKNSKETSSFLPDDTIKEMSNDLYIPSCASPTGLGDPEAFIHSSVNYEINAAGTNQIRMSKRFSSIPDEGPLVIDNSKLPYNSDLDARRYSSPLKSNTDPTNTRKYKDILKTSSNYTSRNNSDILENFAEPIFRKDSPTIKNITEPNTRNNNKNIRVITDPATMKSYTLYNQPHYGKYSDKNLKKAVYFDESKKTYEYGNNDDNSSFKEKRPPLHARPFSMPVNKNANMESQIHEIPTKNGSIYVPNKALDNSSFSTYISGHLENRRGSLHKTMGRLVRNEKMQDNGDKMKKAGKTKIKVYQYKRRSIQL